MENQGENKKVKLFREKSLEAVESPEALNDYLRVTSPGIWMVLGAVILVLTGIILWSVFGRVSTTVKMAVYSSGSETVCYVPYDVLEKVVKTGSVAVDGEEYSLETGTDIRMSTVTEEMSPFLRVAGNLKTGDVIVEAPLAASLPEGVYTGTAVTETLQPISLLLQ